MSFYVDTVLDSRYLEMDVVREREGEWNKNSRRWREEGLNAQWHVAQEPSKWGCIGGDR
jgi:hypothetical protein